MATVETKDYWQLLEDAPDYCEAVSDLFHWSTNYDAGKGPATAFLDLVGYSDDEFGENIYNWSERPSIGYVEADKLGKALQEYADRPGDVMDYVRELLEAESRL